MRTTITVPEELVEQAVALTNAKSRSEAVRRSLEELVANHRVRGFLRECGTFGFEDNWKEQRKLDAESSR